MIQTRQTSPDRFRARDKAYARSLKGQYRTLKAKARTKNLIISLSFDDFVGLRLDKCFYCGGDLPEAGYGLDRKDNTKGYTLDNVIPCCWFCNNLKSSLLTHDEMVVAMKAVTDLRRSKLVDNLPVS
jgi:hypothetical protein